MSDLLRFEISQVFYSKIFVMSVYESIDALKLAVEVKELLLRPSGNGS